MSKIAVVYWSGTGNTEAMAGAVAEGITGAGGEASLLTAAEFDPSLVDSFDAIAFGCPSMGSEELEESEFAPRFESCEPKLSEKKIALFGSYGWGDGDAHLGGNMPGGRGRACLRAGDLQRGPGRRRPGRLPGPGESPGLMLI